MCISCKIPLTLHLKLFTIIIINVSGTIPVLVELMGLGGVGLALNEKSLIRKTSAIRTAVREKCRTLTRQGGGGLCKMHRGHLPSVEGGAF